MIENKRKDIQMTTFKKIENFLKKQDGYIFKSEIVKQIGVDYDSLNLALKMLKIETNKDGMVKLC